MDLKPIKNESDYEQTLAEIETLFEALPNTPEGNRLDVLTALVEAFEQKYHPIPSPDPIDALVYYIESRGLSLSELTPIISQKLDKARC